jgi:ferritin-like metal-binding protein YciE
MAKDTDLNERDAKLVQWLNEAYAKEAELETDLAAHITLTQKPPYKKRLQAHLKETREHKRAVARRIKQLGGQASIGPAIPGVPALVGEAAGKTVSAVKGQVGAARAMVTEQAETHVRNAQEELREEHVEIALYTRIETFATEVGDRETAQLAKRIRREEERMAKFLTSELPRLVKDVVRAEVPRDQRATARRRTTSRSRSTSGTRAGGTRTRAASGASSSSRSSASGSRSTGSSSRASRAGGSTSRASGSGSRASSGSGATSRASRSSGGSSRSSRSSSSNGTSASRPSTRSSRSRSSV